MTGILRTVLLLFTFAVATPLFAQPCDCLTTGNCPVPIMDNGTFQGTLDVTVDGPNDLGACPLTSVCFSITHTWVGDLSVSLTSPSGLNYLVMADVNNGPGGCGTDSDNIDVCIVPGTANPLTNNTEYNCNTGPCFSGTCCLTGDWNVPCGGVVDPITFAAQAPNCDLNDFNVPGNPANGTWTLTVNDICAQDIGTLNNFSLTFSCGTLVCTVCNADGGDLNAPDVASCFGDPSLNLSLPPNYSGTPPPNPSEHGYAYVISQNGTILQVNPTADMSNQPPGTYEVCGLSYALIAIGDIQTLIGMDLVDAQNMLSSTTAPFCADFSSDCIEVVIGPVVLPTILDTMVCLGTCIDVAGSILCQSGQVTIPSWLGCDSTIIVTMIPILVPPTFADTTVCQGDCITIGTQLYCPPGPHTINFQSWQGCDSTVTWQIFEEITAAIINPQNPPPLSCSSPTVTLDGALSIPPGSTFEWSGPSSFSSTDPAIQVSEAGTYTLTVTNNNLSPACTATTSVEVTGNQLEPDLQVNGTPPTICEGEVFDLATLNIVDLNNTDPIITFHSDTPATAANELNPPIVSPTTTTTYYILGTTGGCTDETSVTVTVNPLPTADFTATSPICLDSTATVTYTGSAGANATFNWNFGGGTATPGTGAGPHTVQWAAGGTQTISLVVEENGCTSDPVSQTVAVDVPLTAPVLNCTPSQTSIEFTWNPVPGATDYTVSVVLGPDGTMTSDTSYLVDGLMPNQQSSIIVEAISGNSCGNVNAQITCTAQDCPPVTVTIDPIADICLDGTQMTVPLNATQMGGDGSGVFTFTGPGVNPISGTFNPNNADPGANNILVTYEENTCLYNSSLVINVYPQPTADFTVTSPICSENSSTVNYTGNASANATFTWDFAGGTADPGTGPGPHTVTWADGGNYTISLMVDENDCPSEMNTQNVQVDMPIPEPVVTCDANTSSVEFFWTNVPGADSYSVTVLAGMGGTMTSDTSMLFDGLAPNTIISIEITAEGSGACGNTVVVADCEAQNCPDVTIDIDPVADICLDASAAPFDLAIQINGGAGGGTTTVTGTGISDPAAGTFDPGQAGIGGNQITVTYEEGNCSFTETTTINVYDLPVASFGVNSPICETDEATVTFSGVATPGLIFTWDFGNGTANPGTGQGPHNVSWTDSGPQTISLTLESAQGCISEPFSMDVQVDEPLIAPNISCSSTTSSIEFSWDDVANATDYVVDVLSGPTGTLDLPNNTYTVSNLNPNDEVTIQLTVSGNGACPPVTVEETCVAIDCPPLTIDIDPVAPICLSASVPVQIVADPAGGTWSGPGIIDPLNGMFDATVAGTGPHMITYEYVDGNCSYDATTIIEVFAEPSAGFTASPTICVTDAATVAYAGNASANAIYTWDFGVGTATPGTGLGPHTVTWPSDGTYTISLSVEQDGCASQIFTQDVQVDAELIPPTINCSVTTSSVEFTWDDVTGATDYEVTVLSGAAGSASPNAYLVTGLVPGDETCIELTVSGTTACGPVTATACCTANECPDVIINLTPIDPLCLETITPTINLEAEVTGSSGMGTGTWSGDGVTSDIFDPQSAGVGSHVLTYTYVENANCSYVESIIVEIIAPPSADAGENAKLTCDDNQMDAMLGGTGSSAGPNISYSWSADFGSFPGDSTILNPVVSVPGTYTLTVTNTDLGCSTTDEVVVEASQDVPTAEVTVQPISCYGENDGLISISGVTGGEGPYMYSFNGSAFTEQTTFQQLEPGVYEITVLDANGCESTLTVDMQQPQEVDVELVVYIDGENIIRLGDAVEMEGAIGIPEDSLEVIQWDPAELVDCDTCLYVTSQPIQQTTFTITVEDNGCGDSDQVTIFVKKDRPYYVPNAFSPNGDGVNEVFMIYGGEELVRIKSFLIFDRWGETVYQLFDFPPNDPTYGWDGTYRKQVMNPAVYTWFAEVEFFDGSVELIEGGVTLTR